MAKMRVHELAAELGMQTRDLLDHLKRMGEFVKTASSTLEAPVIRELRKNPPPGAKPQWQRPNQSTSKLQRPTTPRVDPFAAPPSPTRIRPQRGPRPSYRGLADPPSKPRTGWGPDDPMRRIVAEMFDIPVSEVRMPRRKGATTGHAAVDEWLLSWISPEEKREWMRYGLSEDELHIAKQWMQVGMGPKDLAMILPNGRDALWRLKSGESVESVAQRVREARGA